MRNAFTIHATMVLAMLGTASSSSAQDWKSIVRKAKQVVKEANAPSTARHDANAPPQPTPVPDARPAPSVKTETTRASAQESATSPSPVNGQSTSDVPLVQRAWFGPYAPLIGEKLVVVKCVNNGDCSVPMDDVFYSCMAGYGSRIYKGRSRSVQPLTALKVQNILVGIVDEDESCVRRSGNGKVNLKRLITYFEQNQ